MTWLVVYSYFLGLLFGLNFYLDYGYTSRAGAIAKPSILRTSATKTTHLRAQSCRLRRAAACAGGHPSN